MGLSAMYTPANVSPARCCGSLRRVRHVAGPVLSPGRQRQRDPSNSYYGDKLTADERAGIASEEDVSPDDGKASVPPSDLQGVIPDAADPRRATRPSPSLPTMRCPATWTPRPRSRPRARPTSSSTMPRRTIPVSRKEFDECVNQWGPQTQMTKESGRAAAARRCSTSPRATEPPPRARPNRRPRVMNAHANSRFSPCSVRD